MESESRYKCAECGKAVIVYDNVIHRICGHDEAGVTAECSATATGECIAACSISAPNTVLEENSN